MLPHKTSKIGGEGIACPIVSTFMCLRCIVPCLHSLTCCATCEMGLERRGAQHAMHAFRLLTHPLDHGVHGRLFITLTSNIPYTSPVLNHISCKERRGASAVLRSTPSPSYNSKVLRIIENHGLDPKMTWSNLAYSMYILCCTLLGAWEVTCRAEPFAG